MEHKLYECRQHSEQKIDSDQLGHLRQYRMKYRSVIENNSNASLSNRLSTCVYTKINGRKLCYVKHLPVVKVVAYIAAIHTMLPVSCLRKICKILRHFHRKDSHMTLRFSLEHCKRSLGSKRRVQEVGHYMLENYQIGCIYLVAACKRSMNICKFRAFYCYYCTIILTFKITS